jgi:hypothetical protein
MSLQETTKAMARTIQMRRWRKVLGAMLIYLPVLMLVGIILITILATEALGLDIHWVSKTRFYPAMVVAILLFSISIVAGIHLRRSAKELLP